MDSVQFADDVRQQLQADGYEVHRGQAPDGPELTGAFWFTWMKPRMPSAEVGPTVDSEWAAWASALAHRLAESAIALDVEPAPSPAMGPFHPARLPDSAFDPDALAARHGLTHELAQQQVDRLRGQSIYMNERYQVNVETIREPFGPERGTVLWLSIKRRDREPVHDWRELQTIKNMIVGDEHEGFELYPAESRLVDSVNQYHLWVFADPTVRLPVGFRERDVSGPEVAAAQGAKQRPFPEAQRGRSTPAGTSR
jgi:hypothetical protein